MVKSCCAFGCYNKFAKDSGISFYRFPTDKERRSKWISAVKRKDWEPNEHTWLCSAHFVSGKKSNDPLSPDYIPSVFSFTDSPQKRKLQQQIDGYERRRNVKRVRLEGAISDSAEKVSDNFIENTENVEQEQGTMGVEYDSDIVRVEEVICTENKESACMSGHEQAQGPCARTTDTCTNSAESMTDVSMRYIEALEQECFRRSTVVSCSRYSNKEWSVDALKSDDQKVKFYTGLPSFFILMSVFNLVSINSHSDKFVLSKFEEFMITLMKLRLSLFNQDLGYRFEIHQSTISRIFHRWIDAMFIRLKTLIKWPNREELQKSMPMDFRLNFKKCVVIIDCFEIFCERPYPLKAKSSNIFRLQAPQHSEIFNRYCTTRCDYIYI